MRDASHIRSFDDMDLVEHMIFVAEMFVKDHIHNKPENKDKEVKLLFHKPIFTMIKHLHLHILVGNLTTMGKIHFSGCFTT